MSNTTSMSIGKKIGIAFSVITVLLLSIGIIVYIVLKSKKISTEVIPVENTSGNLSGRGTTPDQVPITPDQVPITPQPAPVKTPQPDPDKTVISVDKQFLQDLFGTSTGNLFRGYKQKAVKKVKLELPESSKEPMNLAQVRFYNTATVTDNVTPPIPLTDKNIFMSTIEDNNFYGPDKLIDNDFGTIAHTKNFQESLDKTGSSRRYIIFTFDNPVALTQINIYNRRDDCCRARIDGLTVTLYDSNGNSLAESTPIVYNSNTPSPFLYKYIFDK